MNNVPLVVQARNLARSYMRKPTLPDKKIPRDLVIGFGIGELLENSKQRYEILGRIRGFYKIRCARAVTHGVNGRADFFDKDIRKFLIIAEEYLRCSIRKYIEK